VRMPRRRRRRPRASSLGATANCLGRFCTKCGHLQKPSTTSSSVRWLPPFPCSDFCAVKRKQNAGLLAFLWCALCISSLHASYRILHACLAKSGFWGKKPKNLAQLYCLVLPTGNSDSHRVFANVLAMVHEVRLLKEGVQDRLVHPENRPRAGAPFGGLVARCPQVPGSFCRFCCFASSHGCPVVMFPSCRRAA
jgi:hypothetical protein